MHTRTSGLVFQDGREVTVRLLASALAMFICETNAD